MCRYVCSVVGFIALGLVLCISARAQDPQQVSIPVAQKAPVLHGKLDDSCWQSAAHLTDFKSIESKATEIDVHTRIEAITQQTEAYVARDADFLYIGARCAEASIGELHAEVEERGLLR